MTKIKIFIELTRLNKPIGFMLLFWPCLWGLTLALNQTKEFKLFVYYIVLFFLGSILMRSAGCIFNDIIDKDFDKKVDRTKIDLYLQEEFQLKSHLYIWFYCVSLH